jgi:ubiquinol oxidase
MESAMNAPIVDLSVHHHPKGVSDRIAYGFTKALRLCADTFFAKRYGHRAIVLERSRLCREWSARRSTT